MSRDKPDFLIIGAMKSGTSSLYTDMSKIPGIYLPIDKEPWVLTEEGGLNDYKKRYRDLFRDAPQDALCGEATTGYAFAPLFPNVPDRAKKLCGGKLKLVYIMRDPVERAISHLRHDVLSGRVDVDDAEETLFNDSRYLEVSDYPMQISMWLNQFPRVQLHAIRFENFINNRFLEEAKICKFLGIDVPQVGKEYLVVNPATSIRGAAGPVRALARSNFYRHHVHRHVPSALRQFAKKALMRRKLRGAMFTPSDAAKSYLESNLGHIPEDTNKLLGEIIFGE